MTPLRESRLVRLSLVLFFVLLVGYGLFEASSLLWGPQIALPAGTVIVSEPHATIRGATQNVASITLNGTVVTMTEEGVFEKPVVLMPGSNRFILTAHDKYGRTREDSLDIIYVVPPETRLPLRGSATSPASTTTPE